MIINDGSSIGLSINGNVMMTPFAAVEFDTFQDQDWDPRNSSNDLIGDHVGININSRMSVMSQKWFSNVTGEKLCHDWITYDSASKNLSISFTGFRNNTVEVRQAIYHIIDLRKVLPEWVILGFSAATGPYRFQINTVKSWAFSSSDLKIDEINAQPLPSLESVKRKKGT
ncbi:hypothetical protein L2E82_12521 [Cichorium intybus]|uniref:Uncharacterized protein n=1 Tax=Cichorium intybus TaxID=13427 RepID=A0ACB9GG19_CICIN|nr:hypothetical protein L2E82_12521 [Cichorium intybus]